jgi:hypothetical protein
VQIARYIRSTKVDACIAREQRGSNNPNFKQATRDGRALSGLKVRLDLGPRNDLFLLLFGIKRVERNSVQSDNRLEKKGIANRIEQMVSRYQKRETYARPSRLWIPDAHLVGILDEDQFPLWLLHAKIHNGPDDTPPVR